MLNFRANVLLTGLSILLMQCGEAQRQRYFTRKTKGYPWPLPVNFTSNPSRTCLVTEQLTFDVGSLSSCDIITNAAERTFRNIFGRVRMAENEHPLKALEVVVSLLPAVVSPASLPGECNTDVYPSIDMDESYHLEISCTGNRLGLITAPSVWGFVRALETFSQLVYFDDDGSRRINTSLIDDKPAFPWRGILLDTGHRFIPMSVLMENLEIMAVNKLNVFHWHIVDDPSYPWFSKTFPQLATEGTYPPSVLHTYFPSDVRKLVDRARLLGIRVVPEFDTPGHSQSWGSGIPELLTKCYDDSGNPTGTYGVIDPSNPNLMKILGKIFTEVFTVFPDRYLHLGGDEAYYGFSCWLSNPRVHELMKAYNLTNGPQIQQYYTKQLLAMLDKVDKKNSQFIFWEDVLNNNASLPVDRSVVHVWDHNQTYLGPLTKAGFRAVFSYCWYLDLLTHTRDWTDFYYCDPLAFDVVDENQKKLVLGGEACLWSKYVDSVNALPRLWPRSSAIAERLWSNPSSEDAAHNPNVEWRLEEHRCRMIARGHPVQPVVGPGFCDVEFSSIL